MAGGARSLDVLRLDVVYQQQRTEMSCWWASLAMLIHYHTDHLPLYPWEHEPRFLPPPGEMGAIHWNAVRGGARFLERDEPWQWYQRGIEPDTLHVNRLADLGRLVPLELSTAGRSTFGGRSWWTARLDGAWMEERLRSVGPIYIIRRRGAGHHAFLISGVLQRREGPGGHGLVEIQDPWPGGRARTVPMTEIQSHLAPQLAAYNMLVFRERRAQQRILEEDDEY